MKKAILLGLLVFGLTNVALAVAIDDSITPQNCDRSNPVCAQFMDTTSVGQIKWGGFIAGGLRSLTNLFVDGKLGVGTLRPSIGEQVLKLDVEGAIGAKFYCDENGNHCVAGDKLGVGGGNVSITTTGGGLIFSPTTITNTGSISLDTTFVQKRISGFCATGEAVQKVNQDGTVVCESVGSTNTGDSFWRGSLTGSINNLNSGNVGIGTQNPVSKLEVVSAGTPNIPGVKFTDANYGSFALLNLNGNGAEFAGNQGVYALSPNLPDGIGITGHALGNGETYGGRFISPKIGSYNKGSIGLYAADMNHAYIESNSGRDNKIPASLANSSTQWAGYFDGNVNINGKLNVNGEITVNNQPLSVSADAYKVGDHCGIFTYGAATGFDTNIPCGSTYLFKNWQKAGIPTSDQGMDNKNNWQCPAKFTLAGGDFQSEGNRYMLTCVRSTN